MKFTLKTHRCTLTPAERAELDRRLDLLDRRLQHFDPDLVHLSLDIERHARRSEYRGSIRLVLLNHALPAKRNVAPTPSVLIKRTFEDLEEQVERFKARLRGEYTHERRRASLSPEAVHAVERELLAERELLDRALLGDEAAFRNLINRELPGVSAAIGRMLAERGQDASAEAVEHVLMDVLTRAFSELPRKPARWSYGGWLAWLARRLLEQEARGLVVAQSIESPPHPH